MFFLWNPRKTTIERNINSNIVYLYLVFILSDSIKGSYFIPCTK